MEIVYKVQDVGDDRNMMLVIEGKLTKAKKDKV